MAIFRCPSCGGINRVPEERVSDKPKCGRCKKALDVSGEVQPVVGPALRATIASSPVPVLVDFWAPWCGPCRIAAPVVERLAHDRAGEIVVLKLDTDEDPSTSGSLEIRGIPTFILFSGGQEVARQSGVMQRDALERWVREHTR
jgi:thioredoxin 2